ncbi:unnamed protein product [Closterium sp. NIES-53]
MVREHTAEQPTAGSQQGGAGWGGAEHEARGAMGIGRGAVAPTIDTGLIGTSYGQFKFGVEHISMTPLLEGRHDLPAWVSAIRPQLLCADLWHNPSTTKSVKEFDGSMQGVAGVGEVLLEGTNGLRVTLHDVLFVPGMKANLVFPGQLTDKGENLQTEEGVTRIIALGGQVAATARYRHRLLFLDLKPWPASNGSTAVAACNGTAAAAAYNGMAAGAACNGMVAAAACSGTATGGACNGTMAALPCNGMTKVVADVA